MVTLIRWYLMKAKEIKLKLALYSFAEQGLKYITENTDEFERKFISTFAELIHAQNVAEKLKQEVDSVQIKEEKK